MTFCWTTTAKVAQTSSRSSALPVRCGHEAPMRSLYSLSTSGVSWPGSTLMETKVTSSRSSSVNEDSTSMSDWVRTGHTSGQRVKMNDTTTTPSASVLNRYCSPFWSVSGPMSTAPRASCFPLYAVAVPARSKATMRKARMFFCLMSMHNSVVNSHLGVTLPKEWLMFFCLFSVQRSMAKSQLGVHHSGSA